MPQWSSSSSSSSDLQVRHLVPLSVEGVSTKVVHLRLHQVRGQPVLPLRVKVRQTCRHAWGANTVVHSEADNPPPRAAVHDLLCKLRVYDKVGELGIPVIGLLDTVQE